MKKNSLRSLINAVAFLAFFSVIGISASSVNAAEYYVDQDSGNNANSGLAGSPWKELPGTLSPTGAISGWKKIYAGDKITLSAGDVWSKSVKINSSYYDNATESNPITITSSSTSTRAIFDFASTGAGIGFEVHVQGITFQYLEIRNISTTGSAIGIVFGNDCDTSGKYGKVLHCYIHDIVDTAGYETATNQAFAVNFTISSNNEVAYNTLKNVSKKFIGAGEGGTCPSGPFSPTSYINVHHNVMEDDAAFAGSPMDHGVAMAGNNHSIHDNMVWSERPTTVEPAFAIKVDGTATAGTNNNNRIYNNLVLGWSSGMAIIDVPGVGNNEIVNNTIYLKEMDTYDTSGSGAAINGITLGGSTNVSGNKIRNNIIYGVHPNDTTGASTGMFICAASASCANNLVTNNLFYHDAANVDFRIGSNYRTVTTMETSGVWNGLSGNVAENNIVDNPKFSGGTHPLNNVPSGFDASWHPNADGLNISSDSKAKDMGYALSSPFNADIKNASRPQGSAWDIGAYEYSGSALTPTCSDNIQNQNETGIDCGGVCPACSVVPPAPTTYNLTNFISLFQNWLGIGNSTSDVNNDGIVNTRDLGIMMSNWVN